MASTLERFLAQAAALNDELDDQLAKKLDASSLRCLRALSRTLKAFADRHGEISFSDMYIYAPVRAHETMQALNNVGTFCRSLTINVSVPKEPTPDPVIMDAKSPSKKNKRRSNALRRINVVKKLWDSSLDLFLAVGPAEPPKAEPKSMLRHPDALEMDFRVWEHIIAQFTHIHSLTLRVDGDPAWPGSQEIEETLLLLRICLERSRPRHLRSLTLSPIHAMGIIHLRWSGFGAFTEVPSRSNTQLWQNLTTLDLRMQNPISKIDDKKFSMFLGILYDYLKSFSQTLTCLKFVWDGERQGPSPLALEDEPGLMDRRPIRWPRLESLWFGNITFPNKTTNLLCECAPLCREVKALRSTHRFSEIESDHTSPWYDISIERVNARRHVQSLAASSLYSRQELEDADKDDLHRRVSKTSRIVPFMLDVRSQGEMLLARRHRR